MAENIRLQVVTPEKFVVDDDAKSVMAPGSEGEFGVLVGHTPFLTTLRNGAVRYTDADGQEHQVFVSGGFAEALPDRVTVLAESAERQEDIDVARAQASLERAEKRLNGEAIHPEETVDEVRARAALERALRRLALAGSGRRE
jgi:F-type H+-transporting ATPase subunit epsilon